MPMLVLRTRKVMMTNQRVYLSVLAALTKRFESILVADSLYIEAQKNRQMLKSAWRFSIEMDFK